MNHADKFSIMIDNVGSTICVQLEHCDIYRQKETVIHVLSTALAE